MGAILMYQPDNWVIIKITMVGQPVLFKVLAGWSGGYLDGDSWRMNSGITKVEKEGDYYQFSGWSGSVYKCHKDSEQLRMNMGGTWGLMKERFPDIVELVTVEQLIEELDLV
jgi:hypothetical protein